MEFTSVHYSTERQARHAFIQEHIAEIDEMYTTYISNAERSGEKVDKQEVIRKDIEMLGKKIFVIL